jgi:hypothetical protein
VHIAEKRCHGFYAVRKCIADGDIGEYAEKIFPKKFQRPAAAFPQINAKDSIVQFAKRSQSLHQIDIIAAQCYVTIEKWTTDAMAIFIQNGDNSAPPSLRFQGEKYSFFPMGRII